MKQKYWKNRRERKQVRRFYERAYGEPKQRFLSRTHGRFKLLGDFMNWLGRDTIDMTLHSGASNHKVTPWGFTKRIY